jgi:multiple sugar transport system substrate-binding protein
LAADDVTKPQGQWARWVRDTFQLRFPRFRIQAEDHGWSQTLRTGLLTAIAGGNAPDVTTGEAFVHEFAALGAFAPVPTLAAKQFAYGTVAGSVYKGQLFGVPIATSPFALETNKRVAERAGLDPTKPPKTWDELVANSEKAFQAGNGEFVGFNLYGPAPSNVYGAVLRTIPWINQTGKPLGDDDGTKAYFNSPEHVRAYELSRRLFKTADPGNSFSGDEGKLHAYLWQDKAVYQVSATWSIYDSRNAGGESRFHPLPRLTPGVSGNVVLGNEVYSPLARSRNRDGALEFVKFMAEAETQRQLGRTLGFRLPTTVEVLNDPALARLPAYQPVGDAIRVFADVLLTEDVRPVPPYAKNGDKIWIAWGDAFGKILLSSDPVKRYLDALQADVEKLLG